MISEQSVTKKLDQYRQAYGKAIDPFAQIRKSSRQIYFFEPGAIIEHCRALPKVFLEMNQMPVR